MASTSPSRPGRPGIDNPPRRPARLGLGLGLALARPSAHRLGIATILAAALAFYLWTAASSAAFDAGFPGPDVYNLMTSGLLHGHLYLPLNPPAGLLHLANPYDPAQNGPYQAAYHDLALRGRHLYSTWGPSPMLLFGVFRLTPWVLPQSWAAVLYAFVGLACAVGLLHVLVRRWLPATPGWLLTLASAALALTNVAPFMLRRPAQYEVAISGAYGFEMAGLLLVLTAALAERPRLTRLALGSLLLGLAVAARPTLAAGGLAAGVAAVHLIRRRGAPFRSLAAALVPVILCGLLLAGYNYRRFGSASEFGQHYQLAGLDVQHKPADQLAYVAPGVFGYLTQPPRLSLTFPHVFLSSVSRYPLGVPAGYAGTPGGGAPEPTGGILTTMPITLLVLALPALWHRRRSSERPALLAATGLAGLALAVIGLLSFALWGTTQRYEVDFATLALLSAFVTWALLIARAGGRRGVRAAIVGAGVVLSAIGAAAGTATSLTGYYNGLQFGHPSTFNTLEDLTSPVVTLATIAAGHPALTRVSAPRAVASPVAGYGPIGDPSAGLWLGSAGPVTLTVIAPQAQRASLTAIAAPRPGAPARSAYAIRVGSSGRRVRTVALIAPSVRVPVDLDLGVNRITLSLGSPAATLPEELFLGRLAIGP